jgi:hypothetical protein
MVKKKTLFAPAYVTKENPYTPQVHREVGGLHGRRPGNVQRAQQRNTHSAVRE